MSFDKRIKKRRMSLGLSVSQIARKINEPTSSYIEWENGRKITGEKIYPKLAKALGLSLGELILDQVDPIEEELQRIENSIEKIRLSI